MRSTVDLTPELRIRATSAVAPELGQERLVAAGLA
jgi:hypothetical protein